MPRLEQKTAVITGASSGIGRSIALAFAAEGAHIIVNYNRSDDKAEKIVEEITSAGGKAKATQADVANPDEIDQLIAASQEELGLIDIWVNNAGADILTGQGAQRSDQEKLQELIGVDLKGT
ncbi:MAG: SDR family NAD(P)-dependent oxidoreductase, partial [Gammaproteobacteria bacterium]